MNDQLSAGAGMPTDDPHPGEGDGTGIDSNEIATDVVGHAPTEFDPHAEPILEVRDLRMYFPVKSSGLVRRTIGHVQAVDGVSFQVPAGGSLGLVGESGCGKSTTGRMITRLYEPTSGSILFEGKDIAKTSARGLKPLRREIQMIFQDPYTSLNPRQTVGSIVGAPLAIHRIVPKKKILPRVQELLETVGLNPEHYNRYPHEFSGGQRQRIGIARALTLQPKLLVADEPVSALDVSIQAQVVNLLQDLQKEFGIAFLFVAHDLAVVRHFCPEIAVMYLGKIVEIADRETLYNRPNHPYTQALLSAVPDVKQAAIGGRRERIRLQATSRAPSTALGLPVPHPLPAGAGDLRTGRAAAAPDRQAAQGRLPLRGRAGQPPRASGHGLAARRGRHRYAGPGCDPVPGARQRAGLRGHVVRPEPQDDGERLTVASAH